MPSSSPDLPPDPSVAVPESLTRSGFPFQTAVADSIARTPRWRILTEEFPWRDELGRDHFLDIVAESESGVMLVVEAKKTETEIMTFLLPEPARIEESRARLLHLKELLKAEDTAVARLEVYCTEWILPPQSIESAFCVVSTSAKGNDSRLLERDAQLLIRATDAYAFWEKRSYVFRQLEPRSVQPVIPVVVTNAQLFVANYDQRTVSLETGKFAPIPPHTPVNVVRFRKAFLSHREHARGERTVFVVNAAGLAEILKALSDGRGTYKPFHLPYLE